MQSAVHVTQFAYVADNPQKDFAAPLQLGWLTVRIRRPGSLHEGVISGSDVQAELITLDGLACELHRVGA